jgi:hypothetical protein
VNVLQSLQGQQVRISPSGTGSNKIDICIIRGAFHASLEPLYVIDGIFTQAFSET